MGSAALLIVDDHLRRSFAHFELCAHLPNLRCLLFNAGSEGLNFLLLLRDRRLQLFTLRCCLRNSLSNIAFTAS